MSARTSETRTRSKIYLRRVLLLGLGRGAPAARQRPKPRATRKKSQPLTADDGTDSDDSDGSHAHDGSAAGPQPFMHAVDDEGGDAIDTLFEELELHRIEAVEREELLRDCFRTSFLGGAWHIARQGTGVYGLSFVWVSVHQSVTLSTRGMGAHHGAWAMVHLWQLRLQHLYNHWQEVGELDLYPVHTLPEFTIDETLRGKLAVLSGNALKRRSAIEQLVPTG
eukprot:979004-Amphidinium_carterae.2